MTDGPVECAECGADVEFDDLKIYVPMTGDARPLCLRDQVDVPSHRLYAPAVWGGSSE